MNININTLLLRYLVTLIVVFFGACATQLAMNGVKNIADFLYQAHLTFDILLMAGVLVRSLISVFEETVKIEEVETND